MGGIREWFSNAVEKVKSWFGPKTKNIVDKGSAALAHTLTDEANLTLEQLKKGSESFAQGFEAQRETGRGDLDEILLTKKNDEITYYTKKFTELYTLGGDYHTSLMGFKKTLSDQVTQGTPLTSLQKKQAFAAMMTYIDKHFTGHPDPSAPLIKELEPNSWAQLLLDAEDYKTYVAKTQDLSATNAKNVVKKYDIFYDVFLASLKNSKTKSLFKDDHLANMIASIRNMQLSLEPELTPH